MTRKSFISRSLKDLEKNNKGEEINLLILFGQRRLWQLPAPPVGAGGQGAQGNAHGAASLLGTALLPYLHGGWKLKRKRACMRSGEDWLVGEGETSGRVAKHVPCQTPSPMDRALLLHNTFARGKANSRGTPTLQPRGKTRTHS